MHELYYYGARWYLSGVGIFTQPDTIVPDFRNPQALNRFAYAFNNPVKYVDPSGHDPIDAAWEQEFEQNHGYGPSDQDRRDRLFSVMFPGSGESGSWTQADWDKYYQNKPEYWTGERNFSSEEPGLNRFATHLDRLQGWYKEGEMDRYVQALGFVWGGVPLGHPVPSAAVMAIMPGKAWAQYEPLFEGTKGWDPILVDDRNPSHHWAGLFYTGYWFGPTIGKTSNWLRDGRLSDLNPPDLILGRLAVDQGWALRTGAMPWRLLAPMMWSAVQFGAR